MSSSILALAFVLITSAVSLNSSSVTTTSWQTSFTQVSNNGENVCQVEISKNGESIFIGDCKEVPPKICQDTSFRQSLRQPQVPVIRSIRSIWTGNQVVEIPKIPQPQMPKICQE